MTTPEAKKARQDREGSDGTESLNNSEESVIMYHETNGGQVYETTSINTLKRTSEELKDNDNPIVIVVTKSTRDELLKFLANFDKTKQQTSTVTTNQNETNVTNDTFDMPKAEGMKDAYVDIIDDLNRETKKFSENDLKKDLPEGTDIQSFKDVRKNLSVMHAHCSRTTRLITRIKAGKTPNLYSAEGVFDQNYTDNRTKMIADSRFRNTMKDINFWLANEMIDKCDPVICKGREIIQTIDPIIIAKASRCIQKNKDIAPEWRQNIWGTKPPGSNQRQPYRQQRNDDRENTRNYNRDRHDQRDNERQQYTRRETRRDVYKDPYPHPDYQYRRQSLRHDSNTERYRAPKSSYRQADPEYPRYRQRDPQYDYDRRPYKRQNPTGRRPYMDRQDNNRRADYHDRRDSRH